MKHIRHLIFTLTLATTMPAMANSFKPYKLDIKGPKNFSKTCTASMYRLENQCMTFAPAHCFKSHDVNDLKIKLNKSVTIKSSHLLIDPTKDVAIINYNDSKNCRELTNVKSLSYEQLLEPKYNLNALSYSKKSFKNDKYLYPLDGKKQMIPVIGKIKHSPITKNKLVSYSYIQVVPGMSGATLIDMDTNYALGMIVSAKLAEDVANIVPINELIKIKNETNINSLKNFNYQFSTDQKNYKFKSINNIPSHLKKYNKKHFKLGDNGDADVGNENKQEAHTLDLTSIMMPQSEGVFPLEGPDQNKRLLAVRCDESTKWEQIDGYTKYNVPFKNYKNSSCKNISELEDENKFFSSNDRISIEDVIKLSSKNNTKKCDDNCNDDMQFRLSIFDRMAGNYTDKKDSPLSRHSSFIRKRKSNRYIKRDSDSVFMEVKIMTGIKRLVFTQDSKDRLDYGMNSFRVRSMVYKYSFSDDGKWIYLRLHDPTVLDTKGRAIPGLYDELLVCKNDGALEVACIAPTRANGLVLSLKQSKEGHRELYFSISSSQFSLKDLKKAYRKRRKGLKPQDFTPEIVHKIYGVVYEE